jgi:heme oxygenase
MGLAAAVARCSAAGWLEETRRINALECDLDQLPKNDAVPTQSMCPHYAWGVGYVLNGSCVGAATLIKNRTIPRDWPIAYLRLGSAFTLCGGVKEYFDQLDSCDLNAPSVVHGALETFACFGRTHGADT